MNTTSRKQNIVKVIKSNEKYQNLQAQDSSNLPLHAFDICTFRDRFSNKMEDSQKYNLMKQMFKQTKIFFVSSH